ncbi:YqiA/YcfP family alpha/beta fold hydrolase [Stenotrophomonas mori]|uniref:Alpha/beta fold hydrolase n=1 Tax=Stenotrophomonas mori TaxID=2871096 RepID=A0ABT0SG05_9GAMM|nr:YqiA/YcfP family alpha/beta fold hydrolase [Stenotrophomonas mori]MCL7714254.1 alpha/beta fold hydrolase [Stenotrophomonas mori]
MSRGHCILSHGFESGPEATKVTALADVAQRLGWTHERPDYTDLDARRDISEVGDVPGRLQRLVRLASDAACRGPLVLVGSSLGAYISAIASLHAPVQGLMLMVPPTTMGPMPALDAARVPTSVVHAWHDELIPPAEVIAWAQARSARLLLVDDGHRLDKHVDDAAREFEALLRSL